MYEPIRVFGIGRWIRDAEGQWLLRKFRLQTFAVLQADDLREAAARLRQVEGSDWGKIDDPLAVLKALMGALNKTGRLDDTYVVYTSDNGFHVGEHRLFIGKTTAYEEDIRVPMAVRGPGVPAGQRLGQMVPNNDLAPTFAAIAGVEPPSFVDGRSFLKLLTKPETPWRRSFLIERRQMETHELAGKAIIDGIRTAKHTYVEYGTGERELYDLEKDPFQLANQAETADPALLQAFAARLAELKNCASLNCRILEDLPVEPEATPVAASEVQVKG